jgi:aminoglycoside 2'-N-acetyltransferase I
MLEALAALVPRPFDDVRGFGEVAELLTAHTSALDPATLAAARALLVAVFGLESIDNWEHALGGIHALVYEREELVGHAAVVQRRLLHGGRALRAGYLEGVAVRADCRGLGHGAVMMEALEQVLRGAYDLGALGASDEATTFYAARGWKPWRGPLSALTPTGIESLPASNAHVYVFENGVALDSRGELTCDWRDGELW